MFELRVLTGRHRGAALPLLGEQWLLGADENCDLSLTDHGLKPTHATLTLTGDVWSLSSHKRSAIFNAEYQVVDAIQRLSAGQFFALGDVWMYVAPANASWVSDAEVDQLTATSQSTKKSAEPAQRRPALFLMGFISAVVVCGSTAIGAFGPQPPPQPTAQSPASLTTAQPTTASTAPDKSALALAEIQRMLTERELNGGVAARVKNGRLILTGTVDEPGQALLGRMLNYYQQNSQYLFPVLNQVRVQNPKLPFEIVQIVNGSMSHVVTSTGERLFVGDEVDGLRLTSIAENRLTFAGTYDFEVTW